MATLEFSPEFAYALRQLEQGTDSLFITGKAGTGKSTLLTHFRHQTKKQLAVLAPTGVAAVNVGGATIHSFFGFRPDITPEKAWGLAGRTKKAELYRALELLVIDEISMVRADLLDSVDIFLRRVRTSRHPFGGLRLVMFGDVYQLPPVVTEAERAIFQERYSTPYFFSAEVFSQLALTMIELTHIYRQNEPEFIEILNALREGQLAPSHLAILNARVNPDYAPPPEEYMVFLTGTNQQARTYNSYQLSSLEGEIHRFAAQSTGRFDGGTEPAPRELELKIGAQVMLTANDREKRYYNGSVGRVEDISEENGVPVVSVRLQKGKLIDLAPNTWEMYNFTYSKKTKKVKTEVVGTYTQLPLMLAWGITIHKAQGKTFERLAIDLPYSFAHGQTYVALSRATCLSGLILRHPLSARHVITDPTITTWLTLMRETSLSSTVI